MAVWLCINKDGSEVIFNNFKKPHKRNTLCDGFWSQEENWGDTNPNYQSIELPKGTIFKLIGKELTWEDEPINYGII